MARSAARRSLRQRAILNRPTVRRISKVQKKLDQLADAVRQRAFDEAVDLVQTWASEVQQKEA